MSGVETVAVEAGEADQRLDRWLRRRFPGLTQGRIEKLLPFAATLLPGLENFPDDRLPGTERHDLLDLESDLIADQLRLLQAQAREGAQLTLFRVISPLTFEAERHSVDLGRLQ